MKIGSRTFATVGEVEEYRRRCIDLLFRVTREEIIECPDGCSCLDYVSHPLSRSGSAMVCKYLADIWYRDNVDEEYEVPTIPLHCEIRTELLDL